MKTPHGDKLKALFNNPKLPKSDKSKKDLVLSNYEIWKSSLEDKKLKGDEYLDSIVNATNIYKNFIDLDFIFSSKDDFLYRQKGQLKLDNTVLEECLPYLIDKRLTPGAFENENLFVGDESCYAGLYFGPWIDNGKNKYFLKKKNQDFSVGKTVSFSIDDGCSVESFKMNIAYFVAELKTNLDKTMFQEANATANELKTNVVNSKYFLICEWLDMSIIDSSTSNIDSVIVLRKAKRLSSDIRQKFSNLKGRNSSFTEYKNHIESNPLCIEMFRYLVENINNALPLKTQDNQDQDFKGYF